MTSNYCEYYQLQNDPFSSSSFYLTQPLQSLLEKMVHLSQFSVGLLVVTGTTGVGKTSLANAFGQTFAPEQEYCCLDYRQLQSSQALLYSICEYLALPISSTSSFGALLVALRGFIQDASEDPAVTVVIDNAHLLEDKTLAALVSLFQAPAGHRRLFQFVLMAEPKLMVRLDNLEMPDVLIQDLAIPTMSLADVTGLLNLRMSDAGFKGENLFSEPWVVSWWQSAEGDLAEILESAQSWLTDELESQKAKPTPKLAGFPVAHIIVAAGLCGALVMAYLYQGDNKEKELKSVGTSVTLPVPKINSSEARSVSSIAISVQSFSSDSVDIVKPAVVFDVSSSKMFSTSSSMSSAISISTSSMVGTILADLRPIQPILSEDELTLLSWASDSFTLQVLGVSHEGAAQEFIATQSNRDQLLIFASTRQGKPWYVVVAGHFMSRAQAEQAIKRLPVQQRRAKPWIRSLVGIQLKITQH